MHELSIARDIVRRAVIEAETQSATRVTGIKVHLGKGSHVTPEALEFGVLAASQGTAAEGASLNIMNVSGEEVYLDSIELREV